VLKGNTDEINEMKFIIKSAIDMDEAAILREEEVMASLWKENRVKKTLKEKLLKCGISINFIFDYIFDNLRLMSFYLLF